MSRVRIAALVCGVGLVTAVVAAPPAHADRYGKSDSAGDMRGWHHKEWIVSAAPAHRNLDLRWVLVRHVQHVVMIRAVMSELRKPRAGSYRLSGYVKVNRRARPFSGSRAWSWEVSFDKHHPWRGTDLYVLDGKYHDQFGCDRHIDPRLRAHADYARDRVTVFIPRHCLAPDTKPNVRPRWVRVSVTTEDQARPRRGYFDYLGKPQPRRPLPLINWRQTFFTPRLRAG